MNRFALLCAASAACFSVGATAAQTMNLNGSGSGTVATAYPTANGVVMSYQHFPAFSGSWQLVGTATRTGAFTFEYDSEGFYSFFNVRAGATAFSGANTITLYNAGPVNCCSSPSNGFRYTGSVTMDLVAGQQFGFRLNGSHGDSAQTLNGRFSVLDVTAAVPEPATWALLILGFGAVGGAMRRRSTAYAIAA